jgi:hypothetical protein
MQIPGPPNTGAEQQSPAIAMRVDTTAIVTKISNVKEARALPAGTVAGDRHGGLTFSDAIAAALESRSMSGWQEVRIAEGEVWTIIVLNR